MILQITDRNITRNILPFFLLNYLEVLSLQERTSNPYLQKKRCAISGRHWPCLGLAQGSCRVTLRLPHRSHNVLFRHASLDWSSPISRYVSQIWHEKLKLNDHNFATFELVAQVGVRPTLNFGYEPNPASLLVVEQLKIN